MRKKRRLFLFIILTFICFFSIDLFAKFGFVKPNDILNISMDIPEQKEEDKNISLVLSNTISSVNLLDHFNKNKQKTSAENTPNNNTKNEPLPVAPPPAKVETKNTASNANKTSSKPETPSTKTLDQKKEEILNRIKEQNASNQKPENVSPSIRDIGASHNPVYTVQTSNVISTTLYSGFKPASVNFFSEPLPEEDPGYSIVKGINKGTIIPGYLEVGVVSSSTFCPAIVRVTEDVYYDNKVYIPAGSIFYGEAITDYKTRLIFFDLNTLITGDREVSVKAHLFQKDGSAGFCSEILDLSKKSMWQSFILNVSAGLMNHAKDKSRIYDSYGNVYSVEADTPKNTVIDGAQQGIATLSNRLLADAEKFDIIIYVYPMHVNIMIDEKIPIQRLSAKK